ncbi:MAG: hypothetical protein JJE21_08555 [Spirochaetaceae bacterium]|nr:hypothetical protein [Spirochaetaceae bacterium]
MKIIDYFKLEVVQPGMPTCDKQTLEIFNEGLVKQTLAPMVYFGQAKVYEYEIDKNDIRDFLASIDVNSWKVNKQTNSLNTTFSCYIKYSDNSIIKDNGYRTPKMGDGYVDFDDRLLEMVPFIEKPWLFTK